MKEPKTLLKRFLPDVINDIENAYSNNSIPLELTWQFDIEGEPLFQAGKMACLTGLAKAGKTFHLTRLMTEALGQSYQPVLFFCKEKAGKSVTFMCVAYLSGISQFRLKTGMLDDEDWPKLTSAMQSLLESPYYLEELSNNPKARIETLTRQLTENENSIGGIFIDDFENFKQAWLKENLGSSESDILLYLKKLAAQLACPVLITARIKQTDDIGDLTLSPLNSIEGDGDIAIFCDDIFNITRMEQNHANDYENEGAWVSLQKSKHDRLGNMKYQ